MITAEASPLLEADSDLPEGWESAPLQELFVHVLGGQWGLSPDEKKTSDMLQVKVIRGTEFKNWTKDKGVTAALRLIPAASLKKRQLRLGDLVIEISGGGPDQPVGRTLIIDDDALNKSNLPMICSNFCRQVRLNDSVDPVFVDWALRFQYARGMFNQFQTETTNIRNLNFDQFAENVQIPLPPSREQGRIVERVQQLLGCVNAARERLTQVPSILRRFRQAVLAAACSGRLTADWRGANSPEAGAILLDRIRAKRPARFQDISVRDDLDLPEIPEGWSWANLRFLLSPSEAFCYGVVQPGEDDPNGAFLVRAGDLADGRIETNGLRRIPHPIHEKYRRSQLTGGEVLVTVVGAGIGETALAQPECAGYNIARAVAKLPIRDFDARYIRIWLSTNQAIGWMKGDSREVARPTLNLEQLETLPVPIPSLCEQHEIVRRVEALLKLAEAIEKRVEAATIRTGKLTQAILAKALRGELVPTEAELARREGRSYESASALLDRIRSSRIAPTPSKEPSNGVRRRGKRKRA